jgi:hypothetical protein
VIKAEAQPQPRPAHIGHDSGCVQTLAPLHSLRVFESEKTREVLDRFLAELEPPVIEGGNGLEFLQAVYRDTRVPLSTRMKAAVEALPFETPKLSAMAVASMTGDDFAARLERCLARSARAKLIEGKALPQPE